MSAIKEPHYFATEIREENCDPELRRQMARERRGLREFLSGPMRKKRFDGIVVEQEDYLRLFANAVDESALGEASVCYLWSRTAAERIADAIPDARILRYLTRFARNVWVGFHEDFKSRPHEILQDVFRFLGVDSRFSPDMDRRYLEGQVPRFAGIGWLKRAGFWQAAARVTPSRLRPLFRRALVRKPGAISMDPADRRFLVDFYREDIGKLSGILGRNLDGWLTC